MSMNPTSPPWPALSGAPVKVTPLGGHSTGAWLATYADGTRVVRKHAGELGDAIAGKSPVAVTDAEELAPQVLAALGLRSAAVERIGDRDVRMEYISGTPGDAFADFTTGEVGGWLADSHQGRLLGLADHVMANHDRHGGNWLFTKDEDLVGIDHGNAFHDDHASVSPFADTLYEPSEKDRTQWDLAARNDFSPADLAEARRRLDALAPEFDRLGRGGWHTAMMRRLGEVEEHAAGTARRIPAAGPRDWPGTDYDTPAGPWPVADPDLPAPPTVPAPRKEKTHATGDPRADYDRAAADACAAHTAGDPVAASEARARLKDADDRLKAAGAAPYEADEDEEVDRYDELMSQDSHRDHDRSMLRIAEREGNDDTAAYYAARLAGEPVIDDDARPGQVDAGQGDIPERVAEPGSWIARNLPAPPERAPSDGFGPAVVDDSEVVVIDPAELMFADEALRTFDLADDAVAEYRQHRALGMDEAAAARAVLDAHGEERAVAETAIGLFRDAVAAGSDGETARRSAVVDAADRHTPRVSAAQAERIAAAFADPTPTPEGQRTATAAGEELEEIAAIRAAVDTLPEGAISDADLAGVGVTPEQFARLVDADIDAEAQQRRDDIDTVAAAMTADQARGVARRAADLTRHMDTCPVEVGQCATCSGQVDGDTTFWEVDEPAARARLTTPDPAAESTDHATADPGPGKTDAVLDRIDAVLAEPELPPWGEQVERCADSVRAAADAVHRVELADEDTERAERYAAWNAEDDDTAARAAAHEHGGGL